MKSKLAQACVLVGVGLVCGVVIAQQARPDKKAIAAELQKISAPHSPRICQWLSVTLKVRLHCTFTWPAPIRR